MLVKNITREKERKRVKQSKSTAERHAKESTCNGTGDNVK